jgi:uncharacterized membrane-anchored protein
MKAEKTTANRRAKKAQSLGARIIEGLEEAIAWSKDENIAVRVNHVQIPDVDVSAVRRRMGLSPETPESIEDALRDLR